MKRIAFRAALVAGSLSLLLAGLASIGSPGAPRETSVAAAPSPVSDYLAFEIGTNGKPQVGLYLKDKVPVVVPLVVDPKCNVTNLSSVADLLKISITGTNASGVQLISNGLGSPGSGKCSRSGGRVLQGQQMVLSVGSHLRSLGLGFASANLNVEGKFGASLEYKLGDGAFTSGGVLKSGDNGPDSGDGDNNLVPIAGPAMSITIRPAAGTGEIALENGGDGPLGRTYFELVPLVNCGETVTGPDGIGSIGSASFQRLDNKNGTTCTPITLDIAFETGVVIGGSSHDVITIVPGTDATDGADQVRARASLVWKVDRSSVGGSPRNQADLDAELARQIQYVDDGPIYDLTYCEGGGDDPVHGDGIPVAGAPADGDNFQAWCLLDDTRVLVGDQIVQTIVMDVNGDPKMF